MSDATKNTDRSELRSCPIGVFDSGVGGLTVYRALHERLPNEHFIYLGDTARVPYGTKSMATVERYAIENSRFLASRGIKILVVACNTASALALPKIRESIGLDVVGVIGPGGRKAVELTKDNPHAKIGVIATEATVASNAYFEAIRRTSDTAEVLQTGCPLFVSLAEENWVRESETFSIAAKYLARMKEFAPDALVLGCTHYPILRDVIQQTVGENVKLVDSGEATADEVAQLLKDKDLENRETHIGIRALCDDLDHFYVTDAADRFARVAERFLGTKPSKLEAIEVYGVDELRQKHDP
ncbi:MAG TPA: glutamate racemase [Pyrinomonadaceae bacterium]|nr:glutamate racemase [Chloracidobacterium sp.]MBP9935144.1 glutamate racemase [Pyrinomonadaceae bacterium]MBK9766735.1 glutamate racemase [Chloracidobacterium sp.]MBL0241205.1 glutamate racemase [Chloracidobacterium sp.]HQX55415.1 glutamate racemase [Pyrinomonadaceae bacterium]